MPGWICEDPRQVAVRLKRRLGCTQLEYLCLGLVQIVDFEVDVKLLRHVLARVSRKVVFPVQVLSGSQTVLWGIRWLVPDLRLP